MTIPKNRCSFYLIIVAIVFLFSLSCYASETDVKVFGKVETVSIIRNDDSIEVRLPENFSLELPDYAEYYVQERDEKMDSPIVHIFGISSGSIADFELIINVFDLDTVNHTLLDQLGINLYVFGESSDVLLSEELQVGDLNGLNLAVSNLRFNGVEVTGDVNLVLLSKDTKCICLLMIGRQDNQEIYNQILTEIISTIKI